MKSKIAFLSLVFACLASNAFAVSPSDATTNPNAPTMNQQQQAAQPTGPAQNAQANKDGEVVAFLIVVNKQEVAASKAALNRKLSPGVRKYALRLNRDHSKGLKDTLRLSDKTGIQPVETDAINSLKEKGKQDLNNLKSMNNRQFQVAFVDAMVQDHQNALNQLDTDLPNVSNPTLKQYLQKTRDRVAQHLDVAKNLQNKMQANGENANNPSNPANNQNQQNQQNQQSNQPANQ